MGSYRHKFFHAIFILWALSACTLGDQEELLNTYTLVKLDSVSLKTDSLSPPMSPYLQGLHTDSGFYMIRLNTFTNSLDFFHMGSGEMKRREELYRLGRYGAGDLLAFRLTSSDTVLLLSSLRLSMSTLGNPEIESNLHVDWPAFGNQSARTYRPIMEDQEAWFIPFMGLPGVKDFSNKAKMPVNSLMVKIYKTGSYENLMAWPEELEEESLPEEFYDYSVSGSHLKGQFIYSFPHSDALLLSDLYQTWTWKKAGGGKLPASPANKEELSASPVYGPVYYDPYRKVYLRFVKEPRQTPTLLLYDTDFRWLNAFDARQLPAVDPDHVLIAEEGWWMRKADPRKADYVLLTIQ